MLTGDAKDELSRGRPRAYDDPVERAKHSEEYAYYPTEWKSPFIDRRRKVGWDLYGLLGIAKHRQGAHARAAPPQLRILRRARRPDVHDGPRSMRTGQLARLRHVPAERDGRGARPRASTPARRPRGTSSTRSSSSIWRRRPTSRSSAACRWATADPAAVENTLVTEREPVSQFVRFLDDERRRQEARGPRLPRRVPRHRRPPARTLRGRDQPEADVVWSQAELVQITCRARPACSSPARSRSTPPCSMPAPI